MAIPPVIQRQGSLASAQKQRANALRLYYQSPGICLKCNTTIRVQEHEKVSYVRTKRFCSKSCAASYNNLHLPKRHKTNCCVGCKERIRSDRKFCSEKCRRSFQSLHTSLRQKMKRKTSDYVVTWRQKTKLRAIEYKGGSCQICGYDKSTRALVFHHLDSSKKDFTISSASKSWKTIQSELDKCALLCANCHAEVHDGLIDVACI